MFKKIFHKEFCDASCKKLMLIILPSMDEKFHSEIIKDVEIT